MGKKDLLEPIYHMLMRGRFYFNAPPQEHMIRNEGASVLSQPSRCASLYHNPFLVDFFVVVVSCGWSSIRRINFIQPLMEWLKSGNYESSSSKTDWILLCEICIPAAGVVRREGRD